MTSNSGTPQGKAALTALATSLQIEQPILQIALETALDILPNVRDPGLALQISLARLGYRVDSQRFYYVIRMFRQSFSGVFERKGGLQSQPVHESVREVPKSTVPGTEALGGFLDTLFDVTDFGNRNASFGSTGSSPTVLPAAQWSSFSPFAPSDRSVQYGFMPMAAMRSHNNTTPGNSYYSQESIPRSTGAHHVVPSSRNTNSAVLAEKSENMYDFCIDPDLQDIFAMR